MFATAYTQKKTEIIYSTEKDLKKMCSMISIDKGRMTLQKCIVHLDNK